MGRTSDLTSECGPHCGVQTVGKTKHVGHCQCIVLCHGRRKIKIPTDIRLSGESKPYSALKLTPEEISELEDLNGQPERSET